MLRMLHSEWMKVRGLLMWLLVVISPLFSALAGWLALRNEAEGASSWLLALAMMSTVHAMLFLPLLTGIFAALVCRYEHVSGGWKQLLSLPVSRTQVYVSKFIVIMGLLGLVQLLFLVLLLLLGALLGINSQVPWRALLNPIVGGWMACLPLAALQLAVASAWPSFAAPLAVNVIFTLPNMLVVNSAEYGPYYPWAQPMLAMVPSGEVTVGAFNISYFTLFGIIGGSFLLFFVMGWSYFSRKMI